MKSAIRYFSAVHQGNFDLTTELNAIIDETEKIYQNFINKKFKNQIRKPFDKVIDLKKASKVQKGQIYISPSTSSKINIAIADEDIISSMNYMLFEIKDSQISASYLLWFLSHQQIINYLQCFTTGTVISYLPALAFQKLEIPFPKKKINSLKVDTIQVEAKLNPFRILINQYYTQYLFNLEKGHFLTSAILAGAIAETLIYTYLIEEGINENMLRNRTLGSYIDFAETYLFGKGDMGFPINHYREVQQLRNSAVHPILAKGNIENETEIGIRNFDCFNQIIKYFGL